MSGLSAERIQAIKERLSKPFPQMFAHAAADLRDLLAEVERQAAELSRLQKLGGSLSRTDFQAACNRADAEMKKHHGHSFVHILKTRCQHCGRSPKVRGRCSGWFRTFLVELFNELSAPAAQPIQQGEGK